MIYKDGSSSHVQKAKAKNPFFIEEMRDISIYKKCVVVHGGARDQYQLALALAEKKYLKRLITDYYHSDHFYRVFPLIAEKRYINGLSSKLVNIPFQAFLLSLKMRFEQTFTLHKEMDLVLSKKAYKTACKYNTHLFCYSYYAYHSFRKAQQSGSGMRRILFQLHPHPVSVKKILQQELEVTPQARDSIMYENECQYSQEYLQSLSDESQMADSIVVASTYTMQSLVENGIDAAHIQVVPYGIDQQKFWTRIMSPGYKHLRIIFVGSLVQRKGLSYLLDAVRKLKNAGIELVLCSRGFIDEKLIGHYKDVQLTLKLNLSQKELLHELHNSDVFVLPSLCEGFGHVILEAMACGLPVITTPNTCAPDILEDGKEGFIIPIRDSDSLANKIDWCLKNKEGLYAMGQSASKKASQFTWEKFRKGIIQFYENSISE